MKLYSMAILIISAILKYVSARFGGAFRGGHHVATHNAENGMLGQPCLNDQECNIAVSTTNTLKCALFIDNNGASP